MDPLAETLDANFFPQFLYKITLNLNEFFVIFRKGSRQSDVTNSFFLEYCNNSNVSIPSC